jgi:hypothetical protein
VFASNWLKQIKGRHLAWAWAGDREYGADALGQSGDARTLELLIACLKDQDGDARQYAGKKRQRNSSRSGLTATKYFAKSGRTFRFDDPRPSVQPPPHQSNHEEYPVFR